jgi:hypothetical protein
MHGRTTIKKRLMHVLFNGALSTAEHSTCEMGYLESRTWWKTGLRLKLLCPVDNP